MVEDTKKWFLMREMCCKLTARNVGKMSCHFLFAVFSVLAVINFQTVPAKAGCNQGRGRAAIYSNSDKKLVSFIGDVDVYECGNSSGSFGGFRKGGESTGWSVCFKNCGDPSVTNKQMIRIENGPFLRGEIEKIFGTTCVKEKGRDAKFCWTLN